MASDGQQEITLMADENTNDDAEAAPQGGDALPQVREALNRATARNTELENQVAALSAAQREVAFLRAGIDLDSKPGQLVAKAYDGELDVEAIKAFAADIPGAVKAATAAPETPPTPGPADGPSADELRQQAINASLAAEGAPAGDVPNKPLGMEIMDAAYAVQGGVRQRPSGGMGDRATAAGIQVLLNRAVAGDPEAVFKRADESLYDATERWRQTRR